MKWFNVLKTMMMVLSAVPEMIRNLEAAIPGSNLGSYKLAMLREMVVAAVTAAGMGFDIVETIWDKVQDFAHFCVATFNNAGIFDKEDSADKDVAKSAVSKKPEAF